MHTVKPITTACIHSFPSDVIQVSVHCQAKSPFSPDQHFFYFLQTVNINTPMTMNSRLHPGAPLHRLLLWRSVKISQLGLSSWAFYSLGDLWCTAVRCTVAQYMYMHAFSLSIPPHKRWHIPRFYSTIGPFMLSSRVCSLFLFNKCLLLSPSETEVFVTKYDLIT